MTEAEGFEFELVFALPEGGWEAEGLTDALFEAGFEDALIGLGAPGLLGLALVRAGEEAEAVITDAIRDALAALPRGSRLREVKPDLVSQGDVAARLRVTRQALQKRSLPPPSLGGLYRATELFAALESRPGKVREAVRQARGWFAAAEAAQRINARLSLDG